MKGDWCMTHPIRRVADHGYDWTRLLPDALYGFLAKVFISRSLKAELLVPKTPPGNVIPGGALKSVLRRVC